LASKIFLFFLSLEGSYGTTAKEAVIFSL